MHPRAIAIASACVLAILVAACGADSEPDAEPQESAVSPDEPSTTATTSTEVTDIPAEPTLVEIPDLGGYVWRFAVAPDGQTALMARSEQFIPRTPESVIVQLTLQADGSWGDETAVPWSSLGTADTDPSFSTDGSRVWFSSIRPVDGAPRSDIDVWYVDRAADGSWGEPVNAGAINSPADDLYPSFGRDGSYYVGSDRGGNGFDIWFARPGGDGALGEMSALPAAVNTGSWEFNPVLSPDGGTLVFTAHDRAGGEGAGDLFLSRFDGDAFTAAVPVVDVNTSGDEYHPSFSPDGSVLYFIRAGDLHEISATDAGITG